jgi:hypothetical protein
MLEAIMSDVLSIEAQKALALDLILDAWDQALSKGVEPEMLASVAIFAALADMVDAHGPDSVAEMCEELPERVRAGEFTLNPEDGADA